MRNIPKIRARRLRAVRFRSKARIIWESPSARVPVRRILAPGGRSVSPRRGPPPPPRPENQIDSGQPPIRAEEVLSEAHVHHQEVPDGPSRELIRREKGCPGPLARRTAPRPAPEDRPQAPPQLGGELTPRRERLGLRKEVGDAQPGLSAQDMGSERPLRKRIDAQNPEGSAREGRAWLRILQRRERRFESPP